VSRQKTGRILGYSFQDLLIATVQNLRKLIRHLSQTEPGLAYHLIQLLEPLSKLFQADLYGSFDKLTYQSA
jgi:hypothetical protein